MEVMFETKMMSITKKTILAMIKVIAKTLKVLQKLEFFINKIKVCIATIKVVVKDYIYLNKISHSKKTGTY